jgi:hypothetical protein
MNITELFCTCDDWKKSNNQIIDAQLIAYNHGFKYTGKVFKYCPWCGTALCDKTIVIKEFCDKLRNNMEDLNPEFSKIVDDHFWELT